MDANDAQRPAQGRTGWRHSHTWRDTLAETALKPIGWITWVASIPFRIGGWVAEKIWNS